MKPLFLALSVTAWIIGSSVAAEVPADLPRAIQLAAERMGALILKKDYEGFAKYTYPKVVALMGGEAKLVEAMKRGTKELETRKVKVTRVSFGKASPVVKAGSELQATIPQSTEVEAAGAKRTADSTLIAISTNEGKSWYFVDPSGQDFTALKRTLPNLSAELKLR